MSGMNGYDSAERIRELIITDCIDKVEAKLRKELRISYNPYDVWDEKIFTKRSKNKLRKVIRDIYVQAKNNAYKVNNKEEIKMSKGKSK